MRGRRHVAIDRQVVEKGAHVRHIEITRMGRVVEADVALDPARVGALGVEAILAAPAGPPDAIEELGGLLCGRVHKEGIFVGNVGLIMSGGYRTRSTSGA